MDESGLVVVSTTTIIYRRTSILLPKSLLLQESICLPALAPTAVAARAALLSAVALPAV
jgi:hypothetical protein